MASGLKEDFYFILELKPDAGKAEIRLAYLRLAVLRHPDKNLEDLGACVAFQKLNEAYETLYDENKRILYDAKHKFRQPGSSRARNETPSTKDAEADFHERLRKAKEEREWMEKERVVMENITRLEKAIETIAATIARLERERVEKEGRNPGWWSLLFSSGETEEKKTWRQQLEDSNRWKKEYEDELRRFQKAKAEMHEKRAAQERENSERAARARKAKETFAHHQEEMRAKDETRRAQEKQRKAEETRQKEEMERQKAARETEIRERNLRERLRRTMDAGAARIAAAKKKERETEIQERNLREALRRNMEAEAARIAAEEEKVRDEAARARDEAAQASSQPPNRNPRPHPQHRSWQNGPPRTSNPVPESYRTASSPKSPPRPSHGRQRGPAGPKPQTSCTHKHPWPKVDGRHRCSACSQMLPMYIFQCNGCGVRACNDCRKKLKG